MAISTSTVKLNRRGEGAMLCTPSFAVSFDRNDRLASPNYAGPFALNPAKVIDQITPTCSASRERS